MLTEYVAFMKDTFGNMRSRSNLTAFSAKLRLLAAVIMYSWFFSIHVIENELAIPVYIVFKRNSW